MNKRRWTSLLLAGLLLLPLAACGKKDPGAVSSAPPDEPAVSVIVPVEPEPQPEPKFPYTNPLTGEGLNEDISGKRPIAVMFNNLRKALPQIGIAQADVIYEIVAEGGITRMMGVFQNLEGVGDLGSIRSARDYYVSLALGHDAIYIHAGGSPQAYDAFDSWGITHIDFVNGPVKCAGGTRTGRRPPDWSTPCSPPAKRCWSRCPAASAWTTRQAFLWTGPLTRTRPPETGSRRPS